MSDDREPGEGQDGGFEPTIEESVMASGLHRQGTKRVEGDDDAEGDAGFEPTIEESVMASGLHRQGTKRVEGEDDPEGGDGPGGEAGDDGPAR